MRFVLLLSTLFIAAIARADDGLIVVGPSSYGVKETLDRLSDLLGKKGITVFARIDHSVGAKTIGEELPPTELLIFGNPKMGTPLMQANRRMAIDLPMKVLAWRDNADKVWLGYINPKVLQARHSLTGEDKRFAKMGAALSKLTTTAAGL